jgi:Holliday junction resolvase RusA-like endonuclease
VAGAVNDALANIEPLDLFDGGDPFSPKMLTLAQARDDGGTWTLHIPSEPIAKGRPKLAVVHGHARAYTPKRTRTYEDIIRQTAIREWKRPLIAGRPIWMRATFVRAIPASWSVKKQNAAQAGVLYPVGRPDLDNFWKACVDALNGTVYVDDALIVEGYARKVYGSIPHVVVTLTW